MSRKIILSLSVVVVVALVGCLIMYQASNRESEGIIPDSPVDKNPVSSEETIDRPEVSDDDLGLMSLSRSLLTELMQIIEDEGTGIDVIDLADMTELQLNETIKDVDLSDDQLALVESHYETLDKMRELAESGASPAQIAEEIRPNKRPS
jgi:hypothetical protein